MRKLLKEQRLFLAGKCKHAIQMFEELRRGSPPGDQSSKRGSNYVVWDRNKHVFDWISYVLFMECGSEMLSATRRPKQVESEEIISHQLA
jgi:hypothetical protein